MATRLIQLSDDALVEVEATSGGPEFLSGSLASHVNKRLDDTLSQIRPMLLKICRPFEETWRELNRDKQIDGAELELGFAFEVEGNLYVAKSSANANLKLTIKWK